MNRMAVVAGLVAALAAAFGLGWFARSAVDVDESVATTQPASRPPADAKTVATPNPKERRVDRGAADVVPSTRTVRKSVEPPTDLRDAIASAFAQKRPDAPSPTAEELDALSRGVAEQIENSRRSYELAPKNAVERAVATLVDRSDRVARAKEAGMTMLAGEAEIVVQARGVSARADAGRTRGTTPLDLSTAPSLGPSVENQTYLHGGLVPFGSVFVVEHAEVLALMSETESASASAALGGATLLEAKGRGPRRFRAAYVGAWRLRADRESDASIEARWAAVEMRLVGRVVREIDAPPEKALEWQEDGAEGFLRSSAPIRLQVKAGHQGGNPNEVDLAGRPNGYVRSVSTSPVWDDFAKPESIGDSQVWSEGTGLVPPGRVFHVTRVDWRTRLREDRRGSRFELQMASRPDEFVRRDEKNGSPDSGSWTGDVVVHPGEENRVLVSCSYFGFAEAVVYGRLDKR